MSTYYYGFAVSRIQSYIFETNMLREVIGGSEIIESVCTTMFTESVPTFISDNLLLGAAGNVRYIFDKKEDATTFLHRFSKKLVAIPGIRYSQYLLPIEDALTVSDMDTMDRKLQEQRNCPNVYPDLATMSSKISQRIGRRFVGTDYKEACDAVSLAKRKYKDAASLLAKIKNASNCSFPDDIDKLASASNYVSLLHIDGNGLGAKIEAIKSKYKDNAQSTELVMELKTFSYHLEKATIAAFNATLQAVFPEMTAATKEKVFIPMRPVVLGGDDVTIIIKADLAIAFTTHYLQYFEEFTKEYLGEGGLTACAGVTFIKSKFPLHYAAHLAETICKEAKNKSGRTKSCALFHRVRSSYSYEYEDIIKEEFITKHGLSFIPTPYTITALHTLLEHLETMRTKTTIPVNDIRSWLDMVFKNKAKAAFLFKQLVRKTSPEDLKSIGFSKKMTMEEATPVYDLINFLRI